MPGQLLPDLAHQSINRLMLGLGEELKPHEVAVGTLMPGFMRTARIERVMTSEAVKKMFH